MFWANLQSLTFLFVTASLFIAEAKSIDKMKEVEEVEHDWMIVHPRSSNIDLDLEVVCIIQCYEKELELDDDNTDFKYVMAICGTDDRTYVDRHHFFCAVKCQRVVDIHHFGPCCTGAGYVQSHF